MKANEPIQASAQRVQRALTAAGIESQVVEMPATTRTAREAATAIGCEVGQIVKSLVFRSADGTAVLVLASGANSVNEKLVGQVIGLSIVKASPEFVRESTGFAIGGVPPLGHNNRIRTIMDRDLMQYDKVWAAAGTPFAVFRLTPLELQRSTDATVLNIKTGANKE